MTLQPEDFTHIPEETVRVAKAAFPKGNPYIKLRDELGTIYLDEQFKKLFPNVGQGAQSPGRLALVSVLQFAEGLSDRQAAEAARSRIDWKYMLGLGLEDPGFDFSVLSEFRGRLAAGGVGEQLLNTLLEALKTHKLIKERSQVRTDSTYILAAVRRINRLEKVGETLRYALDILARVAPDWLRERAPESWYERYGVRFEAWRLPPKEAEQMALALQIGEDGYELLTWVNVEGSPEEVRQNKATEILRRVWIQEYYQEDETIFWRKPDNIPPGEMRISSPYDPEARYGKKRGEDWVGYKVHYTETCEEDTPHIIVQAETTPATQTDYAALPNIQKDLAEKQLPPREQIVDQGYMSTQQAVKGERSYGITLVGHPMPDTSWQAKEALGFDLAHFVIDWDRQVVTCPLHCASCAWRESKDDQKHPIINVEFSPCDCDPCPQRLHCTHRKRGARRVTFRPRDEFEALLKLRQEVKTEAFKATYRKRAGIEGTLSQGVRAFDLRRARYIGLAKVHLQHVITATAIDLARVFAWLSSAPVAKTRISSFSALAVPPC